MLVEHHVFIPDDRAKKHKFTFEVNWNESDKATNDSKIIKIGCSCGKSSYVKREDMLQFFFAIGTVEDKKKMIPQSITRVHEQDMFVGIKATKDIRKGEEVNFKFKVSIPCSVVDAIGEVRVEKAMADKVPIIGKKATVKPN